MNRFFLNDVKFEKNVKLKRPKKPKDLEKQETREKTVRRSKRFKMKLMRLVFFFLTVAAIAYASLYTCESLFTISSGQPFKIQMLWEGN